MALEVDDKTIETTENGYLVNLEDWSEAVGAAIAKADELEMTEKHWDVVNYLRDEHFNNGGNEPNERTILKEMGKKWGSKPSSKWVMAVLPATASV